MNEYKEITKEQLPEKFRPLSPWAYFGYSLLFTVPVVGFVFLCIYALGGTRNINLRNWCRSYFCIYVLMIIFVVMVLVFGGASALFGKLI